MEKQRENLRKDLQHLKLVIAALPMTVPEGSPDGRIARHFFDVEEDEREGPYYTVDLAWTRTFQSLSEDEQQALITRGPYGVEAVYSLINNFSRKAGIEDSLDLIHLKVKRLITLTARMVNTSRTAAESSKFLPAAERMNATASSSNVIGKRKATHDDSDSDRPSTTLDTPANNAMFDRVLGIDKFNKKQQAAIAAKGKGKQPERKKQKTHKNNAKKKKGRTTKANSDDDESSDVAVDAEDTDSEQDTPVITVKPGRTPHRKEWAMTHYDGPHKAKTKKGLVWEWRCNWCNSRRTITRTPGCDSYEKESSKMKSSNFIAHLEQCSKLPIKHSWEAFENQLASGNDPDAASDAEHTETLGPAGRSRQVMQAFIDDGKENPCKEVTRRGFREVFVKAVLEDDLPYCAGEKRGLNRAFTYVLPRGIPIPNRKMCERDTERLYKATKQELAGIIEMLESKISIASDLWSSKSFVFAFAGLVGFWINEKWELVRMVLALLPMDETHAGRATAKLIFKSLIELGIAKRLLASAGDNTSSNGTMNRSLCKRIANVEKSVALQREDIQIGCAGHVVHLIVQAILHALGLAPDPDVEDWYEQARGEPQEYDISEDPALLEEEAATAARLANEAAGKVVIIDAEVTEDISDSDSESSASETESDDDSAPAPIAKPTGRAIKKKTVKNALTPVEKVHAIVVDALRSDIRRKRMQRLVSTLCKADYKHLSPIKGMPIRWNTTLAEADRALKLRPAYNQYVSQLPEKLTGQKKAAAVKKQKRLSLSSEDWDEVDVVVIVLEPFKSVTLSLSREDMPSICLVLPMYKHLELHMEEAAEKYTETSPRISHAMKHGLKKLEPYMERETHSPNHLLGVVFHPKMRLRYFDDPAKKWDPSVKTRARELLDREYTKYSKTMPSTTGASTTGGPAPVKKPSRDFLDSAMSTAQPLESQETEIELYLSHAYPMNNSDGVLKWWANNSSHFPVLSRIARDILAVPGVSISVERLFSSCRHTLTDARSSLTADNAARTVVCKEWLKCGLAEDVDYLAGVSTHGG